MDIGQKRIWFPPVSERTPFFPANEADILEIAEGWLKAGHRVALGTVTSVSGSAPRQTGSHVVIRDDGAFEGSVSAGCVESTVIETAMAVLQDGRHRTLTFGASDDGALSVGLTCGGAIAVLIELIA